MAEVEAMAKQLLVLDEVMAVLETHGVGAGLRTRIREQMVSMLRHKARGQVPDGVDVDEPEDGADHVTVSSGYGHRSKRGFVELAINRTLTQMDVLTARAIGLQMIQASEAAIADETVMALMREHVGINDAEQLGHILLDLREIRQGTREALKQGGH